jgi:hypothetical protein
MKFNKADIVKMGGTAIITVLIVLGLHRPSTSEPYYFQVGTSTSQKISWDTALSLQSQYLNFKPLWVNADTSGNMNLQKLQAFVFNARQLDTVINHNVNPNGRDSTADDVYIYFGQQGKFDSSKYGIIHLIVVGAKTVVSPSGNYDTLMINRKNMASPMAASLYDKADPCPPDCPKNPQ